MSITTKRGKQKSFISFTIDESLYISLQELAKEEKRSLSGYLKIVIESIVTDWKESKP